jgi:hypothetical protein
MVALIRKKGALGVSLKEDAMTKTIAELIEQRFGLPERGWTGPVSQK